jgi:hypothetical protein
MSDLALSLKSLSVFRSLLEDELVDAFVSMSETPNAQTQARFCACLYDTLSDNWSKALEERVFSNLNCCVRLACLKKPILCSMHLAAKAELELLDQAARLTPADLGLPALPGWQCEKLDLAQTYFARLEQIGRYGYGDFALYHMFRMELEPNNLDGYILDPVLYPDPIALSDLVGYEVPRNKVIENTEVLLSGHLASNILLYGDAGTGKSATVKAIANAYHDQGLRLIELSKDQLHLLPKLLDQLSANPLKFILFIDDLSFQDSDDDFSALKAVLEGSVAIRSRNTVIYATSNRRHIVRETFQAREGDEVHRQDTMQETISLSERFGIKVYYEKPKKDLYLQIVHALADQYGIQMEKKQLDLAAEQFALRKAGRSARAARQLVEQLAGSAGKGD